MASEAKTMTVPMANVLRRLDRLVAEMSACAGGADPCGSDASAFGAGRRVGAEGEYGWVAEVAGIFTWEAPDLLRAHGVEPDETPMTAEEMDRRCA